MGCSIHVSFKREEEELRKKIKMASRYIGESGWMKLAATEKLERDTKIQQDNNIPMDLGQGSIMELKF